MKTVILLFVISLTTVYCNIDVTVNIKHTSETEQYEVIELGPSYGSLRTVMYKMKEGYVCKKIVKSLRKIWEAKGTERAKELLVSGHGSGMKVIEIHLTDGKTVFIGKRTPWRRYQEYTPEDIVPGE